jgi:hypothetical protein
MTRQNRREFLTTRAAAALATTQAGCLFAAERMPTVKLCQVASYYFPNYHPGDARNDKLQGKGWSP